MFRRNILAVALLATSMTALSGLAAAKSDEFMSGQSYYGQPANAGTAARMVDLGTTNYINVKYGETVNFVSGGKTFSWTFNGLSPRVVSLTKIAPPDFGTKPLTVYVAKDLLNRR